MPSFRTIFALALTTFAAISAAAPIVDGTSQVAQLANVTKVVNNVVQDAGVPNLHVRALNADRRQTDVEALNFVKREEPKPIAAILLQAKAELEATTDKLNVIVKAKAEVNLDDLKVIIDEVHVTLVAAFASVHLIVGQSATFIFNHKGKLWTATEVGTLLISVVVNVVSILSLVMHVVVSASHKAAFVQVSVVVDVLAKVLQVIFVKLNVGIFAATRPQLTDALSKVWTSLHFDVIAAILKNGHA